MNTLSLQISIHDDQVVLVDQEKSLDLPKLRSRPKALPPNSNFEGNLPSEIETYFIRSNRYSEFLAKKEKKKKKNENTSLKKKKGRRKIESIV